MRNFIFALTVVISFTTITSQSYDGYLSSNLTEPTGYNIYVEFLKNVSESSSIINLNWMANSYEGRRIPYVTISKENGLLIEDKLKFLIFGSQHGNEPSGKEALLVLIKDFADGKYNDFLSNINLIIVPQVNPDGGELKQRRSFNDIDLNRTHVNLRNPETEGLHRLFNKYLPHASLDVHETFYYRKSWMEYGFIKTYIQQLGVLNNPNIDKKIIDYSNNKILPYVKNYVEEKGFSFSNYVLGNWHKGEPVRHSNPGIYDGRQSLGIFNTLSFLTEGKNGKTVDDELDRRRDGQYANNFALIEYLSENAGEIKTMVNEARDKLINSKEGETISIRSVYVLGPDSIDITLHNLEKKKDTVFTFPYESKVVSTLSIKKPKGYLIEKYDYTLISMLDKHDIKYHPYKYNTGDYIHQYIIQGDTVKTGDDKYLAANKINVTNSIDFSDYLFLPINQLASNFITMILEPQSMHGPDSRHGIIEGRKLDYFLDAHNAYKILRVESN